MPAASAPRSLTIVHNTEARRFETAVAGTLARADYRMDGNIMRLVHTEVPPEVEGQGIAGALVRAALDYARRQHLHVVPACSYVRDYVRRHPETHDLLPPDVRP
jgi:predicted GNAT family acetyltransferase